MFVRVKHPDIEAEGSVPVAALPLWEKKGYAAIDPDEVARAREEAGITEEQVQAAEEQAQQTDTSGTAADSAETTDGSKKKSGRSGGSST